MGTQPILRKQPVCRHEGPIRRRPVSRFLGGPLLEHNGLFNYAQGNQRRVNVGVIGNIVEGDQTGFTATIIENVVRGSQTGFSLSVLVNYAEKTVKGFVFSAMSIALEKFSGFSISLFAYVGKLEGVMVSPVTAVANSLDSTGIRIGLLHYDLDTKKEHLFVAIHRKKN